MKLREKLQELTLVAEGVKRDASVARVKEYVPAVIDAATSAASNGNWHVNFKVPDSWPFEDALSLCDLLSKLDLHAYVADTGRDNNIRVEWR